MRIEFLPSACADLTEIAAHYRELGGNKLARRMVELIRHKIEILVGHPQSAALYELLPGIRRLVVAKGAYWVFYRVSNTVQIVHIRRGERAPASAEDIN